MNTKRHFTAEFKAKLVQQMLREEQTINQLAAEHGIHPNQLYRWREIALAGLPSLFSGQAAQDQAARQAAHEQQVHDLYAQIGKLTTQLAWWEKKLAGELSRAARQALVDRTDPDVSLKDQAALLTLSRS